MTKNYILKKFKNFDRSNFYLMTKHLNGKKLRDL